MNPFMRQISVTYRCAQRYREAQLADTGLSGCQIPYLIALFHDPVLSQEELARRLHLNKSSVARQLTLLESGGWIRRECDREDKRVLLVSATEQAIAMKTRIRQTLRNWNEYLTEGFTEAERETLSRLMARVADRAEAYVEGGEASCEPSDTM